MVTQTHKTTTEQREFFTDLCDVFDKHRNLPFQEAAAITSNLLGKGGIMNGMPSKELIEIIYKNIQQAAQEIADSGLFKKGAPQGH